MQRRLTFSTLFVCMFAVMMYGSTPHAVKNKDIWLKLLYAKDFTLLDTRLQELYRLVQKDITKENMLDLAFQTFYNSDPQVGKAIKEWQHSQPQSLFALLSWAIYNERLAYLSRGRAFTSKTPPKRLAKMNAYLREAHDTLMAIIKKNPRFSLAYKYLLLELMAHASKKERQKIIEEALHHNPYSLAIRYQYLSLLEPKWGGSLKELKAFMDATRTLYVNNPLLQKQEGYIEYVKADMLRFKKDFDKKEQLAYLDHAITKNPKNARYYIARGNAYYYYWRDDKKAKKDFEKSLAICPQDTISLTMLAKIAFRNNLYDEAMHYIKQALRYDKLNPFALRTKGKIAFSLRKMDNALLLFQDSLIYSGPNAVAYKYMGHIYYRKKNYALAAEYFLKSNEIQPISPGEWYLVTVSQWHDRDCAFVWSAYTYQKRCQNQHKECTKKRLDWAIKSAEFARSKGICPR